MRQDNGRGVVVQGTHHNFPGMHTGTVDGAAEQFLEGDHAVPVVEIQAAEALMLQVSKSGLQKRPGVRRAADGLAGFDRAFEETPADGRNCPELRHCRRADTGFRQKRLRRGRQETVQAAESLQQSAA